MSPIHPAGASRWERAPGCPHPLGRRLPAGVLHHGPLQPRPPHPPALPHQPPHHHHQAPQGGWGSGARAAGRQQEQRPELPAPGDSSRRPAPPGWGARMCRLLWHLGAGVLRGGTGGVCWSLPHLAQHQWWCQQQQQQEEGAEAPGGAACESTLTTGAPALQLVPLQPELQHWLRL